MTIAEISLLILVILMALIHIGLYRRYIEQQCDLKEAIMFIQDILTGKIKIDRILTEEEFINLMNGGKNPNGKK